MIKGVRTELFGAIRDKFGSFVERQVQEGVGRFWRMVQIGTSDKLQI
jgi:hypothetical protein